jgi:hypothetical protein
MISATAITEASNRGQIGQPAAWMIANKRALRLGSESRFCCGAKSGANFSKKPGMPLSTKLVDKFVDCRWKCFFAILAAGANSGAMKCSAAFSGVETGG